MADSVLNSEEADYPDFHQLRKLGIERLQQMSGGQWTDYNLHDPGVTILEQLCYALTDLFYRTGFPIEDLLSDENNNIDYLRNSFFEKSSILSSGPVTATDYAKVIIDEVEEVDRLWVYPVPAGEGSEYKGLYKFLVQVKRGWVESADDNQRHRSIKEQINQCFVKYRNLCEDTSGDITILKPQKIKVLARIAISGTVLPEIMFAKIIRTIENYLNPPLRRFTEKELLDKGYPVDSIHDGPLLTGGIIPDEEFLPKKDSIDPLELIHDLAELEGIIAVRWLSFNGKTTPVQLEELKFPILDMNESLSGIELYLNDYKIKVPEAAYRGQLVNIRQMAQRKLSPVSSSVEQLSGKFRNSNQYYSIQNHFPVIYGIGPDGIPGERTTLKKGLTKQLKGYLMLFEQLMADYLAQLAGIEDLFSSDLTDDAKSYRQPLYSVPGAEDILMDKSGYRNQDWELFKNDSDNPYITALKKLPGSHHSHVFRKEKMIDHMLARFNEILITYPVELFVSLYQPGVIDHSKIILQWKSEFLREIHTQSYSRCRAFDYLSEQELLPFNFHKRMSRLLYIKNNENARLTTALEAFSLDLSKSQSSGKLSISDAYIEKDELSDYTHSFLLSRSEVRKMINEGKLLYRKDINHSGIKFYKQDASILRYGINKSNFKIGPDVIAGGGNWILIYNRPQEKQSESAIAVGQFTQYSQAVRALEGLIALFCEVNINSEGFYLVEHILLRPERKVDELSSPHDDFYNFRLSVIFPSWPARFQEPDFIECAKNLFSLNTPAHLKLDFHCLDIVQMTEFEKLYFNFIEMLKSKPPYTGNTGAATKLSKLLQSYSINSR